MDDGALVLPSVGPDPLPLGTALAAAVGYARGRRPFHYRAPNARTGRWVEIPAFGYERFDRRAGSPGPLGEADILTAEGLHGRLDPESWAALKAVLDDVAPLAEAAVERAAGRTFAELPGEEFSVLAEPGTVGAVLRRTWQHCTDTPGVSPQHVLAALHSRRPSLFPLLSRTTRWQLFPHVGEGDSGVEAVIHRELGANAAAFGRLEGELAALDLRLGRLRLHDVLLWLSGTLRLTHAVALGQALQAGSRPV
ncbi:DUF6308 family protein [Blastococcus tunisiensis]|uniref:Uncharacterized protein n=1 Tax=Blastococcus tunisiensis TaxID=1798228 RepID=A0A1I2BE13_9ACTN|nr:DUF6308 family protein [Blastococcus sp. DSM 46838]SFE54118.1 hypothetical protein SAMN05216574_104128 [Blastococcus sp. DSM 46838]